MVTPNTNPYKHHFADKTIYKAMRNGVPFYKKWRNNIKMLYRRNEPEAFYIGVIIGLFIGLVIIILFANK